MIIKPTRKTAEEHKQYIGPEGSISIITDKPEMRIHDGKTPGGSPASGEGVLRSGDKIPLKDLEDLPVQSLQGALFSALSGGVDGRPVYCLLDHEVTYGWEDSSSELVETPTYGYWRLAEPYSGIRNTLGAAHPIHEFGKLDFLLINISVEERERPGEGSYMSWSGTIRVTGTGDVLLGERELHAWATEPSCLTVLVPLDWSGGAEAIEGVHFIWPPETQNANLLLHHVTLIDGTVEGWMNRHFLGEEQSSGFSLARSKASGVMVVMAGGTAYRSEDDGKTWESLEGSVPELAGAYIRAVEWFEHRDQFVLLCDNHILVSNDGRVWDDFVPLPDIESWTSIRYVPSLGRYYLTAQTDWSSPQLIVDTTDLSNISMPSNDLERRVAVDSGFTWVEEMGRFIKITTPNAGETVHVWSSPDADQWIELVNSMELENTNIGWDGVIWLPHLGKLGIPSTDGSIYVNTVAGNYSAWQVLAGAGNDSGYWSPIAWSPELGVYLREGTLEVSDDLVNWSWRYGSSIYELSLPIIVPEKNLLLAVSWEDWSGDNYSIATRRIDYVVDGRVPRGIGDPLQGEPDDGDPKDYFVRGDKTWSKVTRANVGLSKVENYPIATQKEAEEGIVADKYMTPQRTGQLVDSRLNDVLQALTESFSDAAAALAGSGD